MTTKLVIHDDICDSVYFPVEGRDCAEEMKYFIKNAFDQWGTKYVLLSWREETVESWRKNGGYRSDTLF